MTLTLDIAMLGPSGAGKTSLLASLYAQFPQVTQSTGLVLDPKDSMTSVELAKYRRELEAIGRELVVRKEGIAGTSAFREHTFSLRDQGDSGGSHIDLRFSDYPGGWLTDPDGIPSELDDRLGETDILLVAIDTPALMAEHGRWQHDFNHPQIIADVLKKWAQKPRRMLMLVPLKCEAWTADWDAAQKLAIGVAEEYADVLAAVWASPQSPAVMICPVQTVGSLVFNRYELRNGVVMAKFQGRGPGLKYDPKWTAEPLRLVVESALQHHQESRSFWKIVGDFLSSDGHHLRVALSKLATQRLGPSYGVKGP